MSSRAPNEKECKTCRRNLPRTEFYPCSANNDGLRGSCKECKRTLVHANRRARLSHYRAYDRARLQSAERRQAMRGYRAGRIERHPERRRARQALNNAVYRGKVVRQPCEVCGAPNAEGHHEDYSKPLDVRWLCRTHHAAIHHPATGEVSRG